MTERFKKAYNALYNAFMNDTLVKGDCAACAVGNIVADAQGGTIKKIFEGSVDCNTDNKFWRPLFSTYNGKQTRNLYNVHEQILLESMLFNLTGYTADEMAKVEYAFETNTKILGSRYHRCTPQKIMEDQFNGLMAAMDVLIELDNVKEGTECKDSFKAKFVIS